MVLGLLGADKVAERLPQGLNDVDWPVMKVPMPVAPCNVALVTKICLDLGAEARDDETWAGWCETWADRVAKGLPLGSKLFVSFSLAVLCRLRHVMWCWWPGFALVWVLRPGMMDCDRMTWNLGWQGGKRVSTGLQVVCLLSLGGSMQAAPCNVMWCPRYSLISQSTWFRGVYY